MTNSKTIRRGLLACALGLLTLNLQAQTPAVTATGPAKVDLAVPSNGVNMKAVMYAAKGDGPHPTVVLLHGYPGNEKNLDLAEALQRAGMNVLFFHYRGAWGSEGLFSVPGALDDVKAVKQFLLSDAAKRFSVDATKIGLLGHSFGGFIGIKAITQDADLTCVAALAPANMGLMGRNVASDVNAVSEFEAFMRAPDSIKWGEAPAVVPILENADAYDLNRMGPALKGRPAIIIGASNDEATPLDQHVEPLMAAWKADNVEKLSWTVFLTDHGFSDRRVAVSRLLVSWFRKQCFRVAG